MRIEVREDTKQIILHDVCCIDAIKDFTFSYKQFNDEMIKFANNRDLMRMFNSNFFNYLSTKLSYM